MLAANSRERDGILVGTGAGLTLIALLVLQSVVGSGLLSTRTVTSTTVSTVPDVYYQVASSYANHLNLLNSSYSFALERDYESNATIDVRGVVPGLVGSYTGQSDIGIWLGSFREKFVNFSVSNETQTISPEGSYWVVNSTFDVRAYSSVVGNTEITIAAQDSYAHVGSAWLIAHETWDFLKFDEQFPVG